MTVDADYELAKELHQLLLTTIEQKLDNPQVFQVIAVKTLLVMMIARGLQLLVEEDGNHLERERIIDHLIDNLKIMRNESVIITD